MERSPKKSILFLLFLFFVALAEGCTMADTPRRSLEELRTALLHHDADAALRYVDVDSIVEHMVQDIFAKYEARSDDPLTLLGIRAGRQVASIFMPGLAELARNRVKAAITSPDEGGYFEDVKKGSVWYLAISEDGGTALVKPRGKSDMSFKMKRVAPDRWQIVQIMKQ